MCGIAGLAGLGGDAARDAMAAMLDALAHRGPDDAGQWEDPKARLILGHRRLSILDTSAAGHQPMASAHGRYVLTFNGEIYNFAELRLDLERGGAAPAWRGHSDTEVLLAGFEAWGVEGTLRRCNGMFALAVWDRVQRELLLARDRMGEKPLYLGWIAGRFCFASELGALSRVPGWSARMAPDAIAGFLLAGYVRGPQSAVEGIFRLPPGTLLALPAHALEVPRDWDWLATRLLQYWSLRDVALEGAASPLAGGEGALDLLHSLLREAVAMRMVADVPLGAFLSGGIDSSLVVALMQSQSDSPIRTFSIGFDDLAHDEAPHAAAVARHLGTEHTGLYVGPKQALALVPRLASTFDEPFADSSQLPTLLVSELARRQVTVALSGDGGDELFAGYGRYFAILALWSVLGQWPGWARRGASAGLRLGASLAGALTAPLPRTRSLSSRIDRLGERLAASDVDALRLSFIAGGGTSRLRALPATAGDLSHCLPPSGLDATLRRLMYGDQLDYLPDDILHKVDRASMAYSLEARVPLLDHRVVALSWRFPPAALTSAGQGKQPLRRLLDRYVPRALVERPKQGFAPPLATWLRGPLRDWAEQLFSAASLRDLPMLDAAHVQGLWRAHLRSDADASTALWNVLMLADWRQRFGAGS